MASNPVRIVLCLIGGVVGGVLGYFAFRWILNQGFYALPLPGALVGAGCGLFAASPSRLRGLVCGVAGLVVCLISDWAVTIGLKEPSFLYYLTHIQEQRPITLILIAAGALAAYWFGGDAFGGIWGRSKPAPAARREGDGV